MMTGDASKNIGSFVVGGGDPRSKMKFVTKRNP
jgi:hypothetical protein